MRGPGLLPVWALLAPLALAAAGGAADTYSFSVDGHTPAEQAPGSPAGSYALSGIDGVNYFNGHLNVVIPLLTVKGRGEAQAIVALPIGRKWQVQQQKTATDEYFWMTDEWLSDEDDFKARLYSPGMLVARPVLDPRNLRFCPNGQVKFAHALLRLTFRDADATEYELRPIENQGGPKQLPQQCSAATPLNWGRDFVTADGTAMTFRSDGDILQWGDPAPWPSGAALQGDLRFRDGRVYRIEGGKVTAIRDRNGNRIVFQYTKGRLSKITDSLNRETTFKYMGSCSGGPSNPDGTCPNHEPYVPEVDEITFMGAHNAVRTIAVYYTNLDTALRDSSPACPPAEPGDPGPCRYRDLFPGDPLQNGDNLYNPRVVRRVSFGISGLYDTGYQFSYNVYGEMARVTMPLGCALLPTDKDGLTKDPDQCGQIEYDWWNGMAPPADPEGPGMALIRTGGGRAKGWAAYRRIRERRVVWGDVLERQQIGRPTVAPDSTPAAPLSAVTVVHLDATEVLRRETHVYHGEPGASFRREGIEYAGWNEGRERQTVIQGASGNSLHTTSVFWVQKGAPCTQTPSTGKDEPAQDVRVCKRTETLDTGIASSTDYEYDEFNNPTLTVEHDYGGAALRTTRRTYHADYAAWPTHLRELPLEERVYRGAEQPESLEAQTSWTYDDYGACPLTSYGSPSGWQAPEAGNNRGNATSTTRSVDAPVKVSVDPKGPSIVEKRCFDILGNVVRVEDGRGHATDFVFQDRFGRPDGNARQNAAPSALGGLGAYAYPSEIQSPAVEGVGRMSVFRQYDFGTGKLVDAEDANGVVTAFHYGSGNPPDLRDRLTDVGRAYNQGNGLANQTAISYNDYTRKVAVMRDRDIGLTDGGWRTGDQRERRGLEYDPFGRLIAKRETEGGATVSIRHGYDARGRIAFVSNPRPAAEEGFGTLTEYDALDRPTTIRTVKDDPGRADAGVGQITIAYSGNSTETCDQARRCTTALADALGRVTKVTESDGQASHTTTYGYDSRDQVTEVTQGAQRRSFTYDRLGRLRSTTDPEAGSAGSGSGVTTYSYDGSSNLETKTDPRGATATHRYDGLNRLRTTVYHCPEAGVSCPSIVSRTYDWKGPFPRGRLSSVGNGSSSTLYEHDCLGRVRKSRQDTAGAAYEITYGYDFGDNLLEEIYPSGRIAKTSYSDLGRVYSVSFDDVSLAGETTFWAHGAFRKRRVGNGLWEERLFSPQRLQLENVRLGGPQPSAADLVSIGYLYGTSDNNGNVQRQTTRLPGGAFEQAFGYDGMNRLKSAAEPNGWSQEYEYDRYGNRAVKASTLPLPPGTPTSVAAYLAGRNRFSAATYDAAGNTRLDTAGKEHEYDAESREVSYAGGQVRFEYDADGRRVRKLVAGANGTRAITYVYDIRGRVVAEYGDDVGVGTRFVLQDAVGSTRLVTDTAGAVVARHDYLPFGEELPAGVGGRTTVQGYGLADGLRHRFTGKERDPETGLDYFGARYYGSKIGRFTTTDPVYTWQENLVDPQRWNRYAYARNNPLRYTDPDGKFVVPFLVVVGVAAGYAILASPEIANAPGPNDPLFKSDQSGKLIANAALAVTSLKAIFPTEGLSPPDQRDSTSSLKGTNEPGQVASRASFRKATVQDSWDNAEPGPSGGRACPTCGTEVGAAPFSGKPRDWDVSHDPSWTRREFPANVTRKEIRDNYQQGTGLECPSCNRARGNRDETRPR